MKLGEPGALPSKKSIGRFRRTRSSSPGSPISEAVALGALSFRVGSWATCSMMTLRPLSTLAMKVCS